MIRAIRTSLNGERHQHLPPLDEQTGCESLQTLVVDSSQRFQTHLGFGGAFTEAAAYALSRVDSSLRNEAIRAYFCSEGLRYNLGRTHMNSCDFALGNYYYIPFGATSLDDFDMSRDDKLIVPLIKDAEAARGGRIELLVSPWSPPPHFKDTNEMNYGGSLREEFAPLYAEYYCRYIKELRARGLSVSFISVQNEPLSAQVWDSCYYSAEQERDFVKHHLAPALQRAGLNDVKLLIWDHNRDKMIERASVVYADREVSDSVWGTGIHWYCKGQHENLTVHKTLFPSKHILFTEGCVEYKPFLDDKERSTRGDWRHAERYALNYINDANNYCEGFIDWNLVLDQDGGPNHVGNNCEAPIMADSVNNVLIYNPSYYYIGHFSRYIDVGAVRVFSAHSCGDEVAMTAYRNKDGATVVVVMNTGWIKSYRLVIDGKQYKVSLPDHSITTYITDQQGEI